MRKVITWILTLLMLCVLSVPAFAAQSDTTVYVTVSDGSGALVLTREPVTVTDTDGDGALTIQDTLYAAHEAKYTGGAAAGYASADGEYGLYITTLWGDASGSYGYFLNNVSAMGLGDPVKDGDVLNAFVYADQENWSDAYCWFDQGEVSGKAGDSVTLTLTCQSYDADWNPVELPVSGAVITVDGKDTALTTDAEGKAVLTLEAGSHVISARSDAQVLVPPVCVTDAPAAGFPVWAYVFIGVAVAAVVVAVVVVLVRKKK